MTIISKNGFCPACLMTKKVMDSKGIKYNIKHLDSNTQKAHVKDLGLKSYPIVEPHDKLDNTIWTGFHPEYINNSKMIYAKKD